MSERSFKRKAKIAPAAGLADVIHGKARQRRSRQRALHEIADHAPARRNDLLPGLAISYIAIEQLVPAERRVRCRDAAQIARIRASIEKFGVCQPILVDGASRIVHGHSVVEAARAAGLAELPVILIDHLSQADLRLLSIALNRLAELGNWDEDALKLEIEDLIDLGEDVIVSGFEEAEIDFLLLEDDGDAPEDEEFPIQIGAAVSRPDDVWKLGPHLLLHGDAVEPSSYERLMQPGELARIVLTDEPFNVPNLGHVTSKPHHREFAMAAGEMTAEEFTAFNRSWMSLCSERLVDGGLLATFIDWRSIDVVVACGRALELELINVVVWSKSNAGQGSLWRSQHELLPVFKRGSAKHVNNVELGRFGRWRSNVWNYPGASSLGSDARHGLSDHPTVKPRALLEDALLDVTNRGDVVLEPFAGSGSTLIAAEGTGRVCRAIEIDGPYCDLIIRRWQAMTGEAAKLGETGETFAEIEERRAAEGGK